MIRDEKNEYHDEERGLDSIRKSLLNGWRQVNQEARV